MCLTYHFTYPCGHTRTLLSSHCISLTPYSLDPSAPPSPSPANDTHPNTAANHATSSQDLGDPGDGCRVCMVRDGVLEVEMLAPPYTRAAGGSVGGGRDEELAARWASMPNAVVIPAPMRQAATPTAAPGRLRHEIREGIVERVRAFTLRRMNAAAVAAGGAPASSPLVSSPLAVAPSAPASSAGDPPPPPTTAGAAPR